MFLKKKKKPRSNLSKKKKKKHTFKSITKVSNNYFAKKIES